MYDGYMEVTSDRLYVEPGTTKTVHFERDKRESVVDIYVSTESLKVFDTPWTEDMSPHAPGAAGAQHIVTFVNKTSLKNRLRSPSVLLGVLCILLVIVIICVSVKFHDGQCSNNTEPTKHPELEINCTKPIEAGGGRHKNP